MALSALFVFLLSATPAHAVLNARFCAESANSVETLKAFSPRQLCEAAGGFPCANAKNMAQAVCIAANEGMCAFLKSSDDARYVNHIQALCNTQQPPYAPGALVPTHF